MINFGAIVRALTSVSIPLSLSVYWPAEPGCGVGAGVRIEGALFRQYKWTPISTASGEGLTVCPLSVTSAGRATKRPAASRGRAPGSPPAARRKTPEHRRVAVQERDGPVHVQIRQRLATPLLSVRPPRSSSSADEETMSVDSTRSCSVAPSVLMQLSLRLNGLRCPVPRGEMRRGAARSDGL